MIGSGTLRIEPNCFGEALDSPVVLAICQVLDALLDGRDGPHVLSLTWQVLPVLYFHFSSLLMTLAEPMTEGEARFPGGTPLIRALTMQR